MAGDVVAFDSLSGNANIAVNVASACTSLVVSGTYTGTLTFNSSLTVSGTITFISGMTLAGTTGPLVPNATATLTSAGKTIPCPLAFGISATYTLADNWAVTGLVTAGVTTGGTTLTGNQITCAGGFTKGGTTATVSGTTKLVLTGGTWQAGGAGVINTSLDLAGNVTVSGAIIWGGVGATLRYLSGTITTTGSTITSNSASTWNTAGVTWDSLVLAGGVTYTLSSTLAWSGTLTASSGTFTGAGAISGTGAVALTGTPTLTLNNTGGLTTTGTMTLPNAACTFAGSAGWTVGTLTSASLSAARIVTLTFGNTYTITASFNNTSLATNFAHSFVSSSPGNKVVLTLSPGGTSDLVYVNPTDIDSSAGAQVVSTRGVITTSLNWVTAATGGGGGAQNLFIGGMV